MNADISFAFYFRGIDRSRGFLWSVSLLRQAGRLDDGAAPRPAGRQSQPSRCARWRGRGDARPLFGCRSSSFSLHGEVLCRKPMSADMTAGRTLMIPIRSRARKLLIRPGPCFPPAADPLLHPCASKARAFPAPMVHRSETQAYTRPVSTASEPAQDPPTRRTPLWAAAPCD